MPKLRDYFNYRLHLGTDRMSGRELLELAAPSSDLATRAMWMARLLRWLKGDEVRLDSRLNFLLTQLRNDAALRERCSSAFQTLLRDASALRLLIPDEFEPEFGLWSQALRMCLDRVLPKPARHDLYEIFSHARWGRKEAAWLVSLDDERLREISSLMTGDDDASDRLRPVRRSLRESTLLLSSTVAHLGLSPLVRERHQQAAILDSPFLSLNEFVLKNDFSERRPLEEEIAEFEARLGQVRLALRAVHAHMNASGVSVDLVYRLNLIEKSVQRLDTIFHVQVAAEPARAALELVADVLRSDRERASLRDLFRSQLYLLSRKIVERNGHSGEHYIAGDRKELNRIFVTGLGGGAIVVGMTVLKTVLHGLELPPLLAAFALWIVYSGGFLIMQATNQTLATKLPSFFAAHLARKLAGAKTQEEASLIREDFNAALRSQLYAFAGNVIALVPLAFCFSWAAAKIGFHLLSDADSLKLISQTHPFRSTVVFLGALTGVELWLSSIAGGYFENWLVFRKIPEAIRFHPLMRRFFGDARMDRFAALLLKHASTAASNLALGFMFGFVPLVGMFFNVGTESRHVTILSSQLVLSVAQLSALPISPLIWAFAGVLLVGLANFSVSFGLALSVALRATRIHAGWWKAVFRAKSRSEQAASELKASAGACSYSDKDDLK